MRCLGRASAAAGFCLAALACEPQQIDPMKVQPKYLAYGQSSFFADGRAMRTPIPGTVPREKRLGTAALTEGLGPEGRPIDRIPIPLSREAIERARTSFDVLCAACHGTLGDGNSVVARKMSLRPPPSLHDFKDRPDGFFYATITQGYGFMPTYADMLSIEERWRVVAYVRALQLSQAQPFPSAPPDVQRRLRKEQP